MKPFRPLDFGPFPADRIGSALGCVMQPGAAHMTSNAQAHAQGKHPNDFATCMAAMPDALQRPTFAGQGPHHTDNFELIYELPGRSKAVLVAISIELDDQGRYRIRSTYLIDRSKVQDRVRKGRLRPVRAP